MPCLRKSGLADEQLAHVWQLADADADGRLDGDEFVLAMHLANWVVKNRAPLPEALPAAMREMVPAPVSYTHLTLPTILRV